MLLSLFCGAGGLDIGFEAAGFSVGLAFDKRPDSVASYNWNHKGKDVAHVQDIRTLDLATLDRLHNGTFKPSGVIGGPPCQSFSKANSGASDDDPRHQLPLVYASLICTLNARSAIDFFVFENVPGLKSEKHRHRYAELLNALSPHFNLEEKILNATRYRTPQSRERLFLVGFNSKKYPKQKWCPPQPTTEPDADLSVRGAIGTLMEPTLYVRGMTAAQPPLHPNHWCMTPKSKRFREEGALQPGDSRKRSFKTLSWEKPSITVAYGNREVHVHPTCKRRLSVYEAMLLQGFPEDYVLTGSLSSQITQVSEAVPPPMAEAVAESVKQQLCMNALAPKRAAA